MQLEILYNIKTYKILLINKMIKGGIYYGKGY